VLLVIMPCDSRNEILAQSLSWQEAMADIAQYLVSVSISRLVRTETGHLERATGFAFIQEG